MLSNRLLMLLAWSPHLHGHYFLDPALQWVNSECSGGMTWFCVYLVASTAVFDSGCWLLGQEKGARIMALYLYALRNSDLEIAR